MRSSTAIKRTLGPDAAAKAGVALRHTRQRNRQTSRDDSISWFTYKLILILILILINWRFRHRMLL